MTDTDTDDLKEHPKRGLIRFAVAVVAITLVIAAGLTWLVWDYAGLWGRTPSTTGNVALPNSAERAKQ